MKLTRRQLIGLIKEELSESGDQSLPAWERPEQSLEDRVKFMEEWMDDLQREISELRAIQKQGTN
jgi:hypothetical protein